MPRKKIIVDTGVISRCLGLRASMPELFSAVQRLSVDSDYTLCMTVPIAMEVEQWLMYAYKNSDTKRLKVAQDFIRQIQVLPYTRDAQKLSVEFAKRYSVGGVSDLMTAAIAATERIEVFTLNRKDYKRIQGVLLYTPDNWPSIAKEI